MVSQKLYSLVGRLVAAQIHYLQRYTRCSQRERCRDWIGSYRDLESDVHCCAVAAAGRQDRATAVEVARFEPVIVDEQCSRDEIAVVNEVLGPVEVVDGSGYGAA